MLSKFPNDNFGLKDILRLIAPSRLLESSLTLKPILVYDWNTPDFSEMLFTLILLGWCLFFSACATNKCYYPSVPIPVSKIRTYAVLENPDNCMSQNITVFTTARGRLMYSNSDQDWVKAAMLYIEWVRFHSVSIPYIYAICWHSFYINSHKAKFTELMDLIQVTHTNKTSDITKDASNFSLMRTWPRRSDFVWTMSYWVKSGYEKTDCIAIFRTKSVLSDVTVGNKTYMEVLLYAGILFMDSHGDSYSRCSYNNWAIKWREYVDSVRCVFCLLGHLSEFCMLRIR